MKVDSYQCDGCGKQKPVATPQNPQPPNHWWILNSDAAHGLLNLMSWDESQLVIRPQVKWLHLCGAECVQRKVSEFLGTK